MSNCYGDTSTHVFPKFSEHEESPEHKGIGASSDEWEDYCQGAHNYQHSPEPLPGTVQGMESSPEMPDITRRTALTSPAGSWDPLMHGAT